MLEVSDLPILKYLEKIPTSLIQFLLFFLLTRTQNMDIFIYFMLLHVTTSSFICMKNSNAWPDFWIIFIQMGQVKNTTAQKMKFSIKDFFIFCAMCTIRQVLLLPFLKWKIEFFLHLVRMRNGEQQRSRDHQGEATGKFQ